MISVSNLSYAFKIGKKGKENIVPVLHDVNLQVAEGEIVAVVGRSGSGKSTLLNLISGFIQPEVGNITINGTNVSRFSESKWAEFRLNHLGFIFQSFQLIPSMSAFENVELPLVLKGVGEHERKKRTEEMLKRVGLESFQNHYPGELSGGQQQRVSIARALILNPPLILADEPTGSLDSENEKQLLSFIKELNEKYGITFLMITHDHEVASIAHRKVEIIDGYLREGRMLHEVQR
ncbi:ABC transporter ATP-binding protein [Fictibacillus arsenicus]|jgi:acetoin utilization transport system ATP-binding protein|uniref:ABC transporter ATP-binding protein n=1 Tax=Fictibacillus arsenicus TaxID=255247 RepID=A0A1B1Z7P4_9BACL|nr:ABC transporter ATP-binding protein [Fictibacillus arsenicus]ANX13493.1 ABC transporter ATP-binding protein [Fictibacillus arsenicus]